MRIFVKVKCCLCRYDVSGFPTLKFFPKKNKAGEEYEGGRDLEDFVNFINEKSGTNRDGKGQLLAKVGILNRILQLCSSASFTYRFKIFIGWHYSNFGCVGEGVCCC